MNKPERARSQLRRDRQPAAHVGRTAPSASSATASFQPDSYAIGAPSQLKPTAASLKLGIFDIVLGKYTNGATSEVRK
ncbi:MAG: hypothetical protein ABSH09_36830 [Bryobacteraceae bacterium]